MTVVNAGAAAAGPFLVRDEHCFGMNADMGYVDPSVSHPSGYLARDAVEIP